MSRMFMKTMLALVAAAALQSAQAHEDVQARHGGTVATADDLAFELVARGDAAVLYVEDHGEPLATEGMAGKLTVLNGAARSEAALTATGGNRLEAKGIKLAPGAKAVAALTLPGARVVTVRFSVPR